MTDKSLAIVPLRDQFPGNKDQNKEVMIAPEDAEYEEVMPGEEVNESLKVGMTLPVPGWQWVKLEKSAANANNHFGRGGTCGIGDMEGPYGGQTVTILSFSDDKKSSLVEYHTKKNVSGTKCPDGAVFYLKNAELEMFPLLTAMRINAGRGDEQEIEDILNSKERQEITIENLGITLATGMDFRVPEWQWVNIVNKEPISHSNHTYHKGNSCGIEYQGTVTILGFTRDKSRTLLKYSSPRDHWAAGTEGPSGAMFLLPTSDILYFAMVPDLLCQAKKYAEAEIKRSLVTASFNKNSEKPKVIGPEANDSGVGNKKSGWIANLLKFGK